MEPGQTALSLDKRYNYRNYEMPTPLGVRGQTKLTDRNLSGPSVTFQQMMNPVQQTIDQHASTVSTGLQGPTGLHGPAGLHGPTGLHVPTGLQAFNNLPSGPKIKPGMGIIQSDQQSGAYNFSSAKHQLSMDDLKFNPQNNGLKFRGSTDEALSRPPLNSSSRNGDWRSNNIGNRQSTQSARLAGVNTPRKSGTIYDRCFGSAKNKKKAMASKECFRMKEKMDYQNLLSRFSSTPYPGSTSAAYSVEKHFDDNSMISGQMTPAYRKFQQGFTLSSSEKTSRPEDGKMNNTSRDNTNNGSGLDKLLKRLESNRQMLSNIVTSKGMGDHSSFSEASWTALKPSSGMSSSSSSQKSTADFSAKMFTSLQPRHNSNQPVKAVHAENQENLSAGKQSETSLNKTSQSALNGVRAEDSGKKSRTVSPPSVEVFGDSKPSVLQSRNCDFEKAIKESPYARSDFLSAISRKSEIENRKLSIKEKETEVQFYKEKRENEEEQVIRKMKDLLRTTRRIPIPTEVTYPEEEDDDDLEIFEIPEEEEEEEVADEFPELSDEQEEAVNRAFKSGPGDQVLSEGFRLQITRKDIATLAGLNWLNDEIINFYMNLLMERGKQDNFPKVYSFNTFFYPKVMSEGQKAVRRWTKSVDVFSFDYILIPVHLGVHWCLAVIDFRRKSIRYYDSMGGNNRQCLVALRDYLVAECKDKKQSTFDTTGWEMQIVKEIPQQMNGSDCGMFACKFAEYITRDADITFNQAHMPYFRRRMVYEILTKQLL